MSQRNQGSLDNYKPLLEERARLWKTKKEIEARIKQLDADLRPVLTGRGEIFHNGFSFNVTNVAGSWRINREKVEELCAKFGVDPTSVMKQSAPSNKFVVKEVTEV